MYIRDPRGRFGVTRAALPKRAPCLPRALLIPRRVRPSKTEEVAQPMACDLQQQTRTSDAELPGSSRSPSCEAALVAKVGFPQPPGRPQFFIPLPPDDFALARQVSDAGRERRSPVVELDRARRALPVRGKGPSTPTRNQFVRLLRSSFRYPGMSVESELSERSVRHLHTKYAGLASVTLLQSYFASLSTLSSGAQITSQPTAHRKESGQASRPASRR